MTVLLLEIQPKRIDGLWHLGVRVAEEVAVGTELDHLYVTRIHRDPAGGEPHWSLIKDYPLRLRIERLYQYERDWDKMETGMTVLVIASGDGAILPEAWKLDGKGVGFTLVDAQGLHSREFPYEDLFGEASMPPRR